MHCVFLENQTTAPGDAVYCHTASPRLTDCVFRFNGTPSAEGGAIACDSLSYPVLESCAFVDNVASVGGAISARATSGLTLLGCTFTGNTADFGGACYVRRAALTLVACNFVGNSANENGGALDVEYSSPAIDGCLFQDNTALGAGGFGWGGALHFMFGCAPEITGTRFVGNSVTCAGVFAVGGAVHFAHECAPSFQGCIFTDNRALVEGGGGAVCSNMSSSATFSNCRFQGNSSPEYGGAVDHENSAGLIVFNDCEFSGNSAEWGGALDFLDSAGRLERCTLAANTGQAAGGIALEEASSCELANTIIAFSSQGPAVFLGGSAACLLSCCDLYGNEGGDWTGPIAGQLGTNGNLWADPIFCGVQNLEMPYSLNEVSPCAPEFNPQCGLIGAYPVGCGTASAGESEPAGRAQPLLELAAIVPNPFVTSARIDYRVGTGAGGPMTLRVYDAAGRLVRTLSPAAPAQGYSSLTWDGSTADGSRLASGAYLLELRCAHQQTVRSIVLLH